MSFKKVITLNLRVSKASLIYAFSALLCFNSHSLFSRNSIKPISLSEQTIEAEDLKPQGRTRIGSRGLELITSGAHFSFEFIGKDFKVKASLPEWLDHNYLQYEVDGKYQKRIKINSNNNQPLILSANSYGKHLITIYKATEAQSGAIFIENIKANKAKALPIVKRPLIEFIGNSITCGAASDLSDFPCGSGVYLDQHNAYLAYGPRVARALNCDFILNSVSGIGAYRNWNSNGPTMPQVYKTQSLNKEDEKEWDFAIYKPDIISIALGTNDMSDGDRKTPRLPFNQDEFVDVYLKFIQDIKSLHPEAKIVLLNSPIMQDNKKATLESCLQKIKERIDGLYPNDKPVTLIYFSSLKPRGCTGHPSTEDHGIMAREVVPYFKELLSSIRNNNNK